MARKKLAVVADPYTSTLYRMLGAIALGAKDSDEARRALEELSTRDDVGVVLVAAEYYKNIEDDVRRLYKERKDLVITILPSPREKGKPMNVQYELLRALGMA
ncbi:MAG: V-type ATP synthase subunit F [Pyrodictiaceae archaeon]